MVSILRTWYQLLAYLGQVYRFRYVVTGKVEALTTSITYQEMALKLRPDGHLPALEYDGGPCSRLVRRLVGSPEPVHQRDFFSSRRPTPRPFG